MTDFRLAAVFPAALIAVAVAGSAPAVKGQATPRSLYVSVVDQNGAPVPDLHASDFIVREDKVTREVLSVGPASDPMQVALLVDDSQAAEEFIPNYREALPLFLNSLMTSEGP